MTLRDFTDIHTHNLNAGDNALINLPWGSDIPLKGYYSVGIHPWDTATTTEADLKRLDELAADDRIFAIGECGLDALKGASLQRQEEIFRHHAELSERLEKPMVIHTVRTLDRLMRLRKELKPRQRWIIHGFRGKGATARQLLSLGFDISIGSKYNPEILEVIPSEHLFHETD